MPYISVFCGQNAYGTDYYSIAIGFYLDTVPSALVFLATSAYVTVLAAVLAFAARVADELHTLLRWDGLL